METVLNLFRDLYQAIHNINEKYRVPCIQMTPMVRFWLIMLRLYLLGMLLLLAYKFVTLLVH